MAFETGSRFQWNGAYLMPDSSWVQEWINLETKETKTMTGAESIAFEKALPVKPVVYCTPRAWSTSGVHEVTDQALA